VFTEWLSNTFPTWFTPEIIITIMSTFLAIIITVVLLKVDLSKLTRCFRRQKTIQG
jgi:hypothetical protein